MAGKEAIFIVLDVGKQMHEPYSGQPKKTRLEVSIDCIQLMLQQKIFNCKTHEVGLILFGSDEASDGNTIYLREIKKPDLEFVRNTLELKDHEVQKMEGGDIFDALDKTIATLDDYVRTKKYDKKIFVMTAGFGQTSYDEQQIAKLTQSAQLVRVKINVIALDFLKGYDPAENKLSFDDDPDQTLEQNNNQKMLYLMKEELQENLMMFPAKMAIQLYQQFRSKAHTQRALWRGPFVIFKDLSIEVTLYKKLGEEKLPSLKQCSLISQSCGTIQKDTVFYQQDGDQSHITGTDQIIKGYYYGKQLVPISKTMEEAMQYSSMKSIKLLGFADQNLVQRHSFMSGIDMVQPCDGAYNQKCFYSLLQACLNLKKCIIVSYFRTEKKTTPKLCCLWPNKSKKQYCFWKVELPTAESIRDFQFNSLKESTQDQQKAIGELIDAMDLEKVPDENDPTVVREMLKPKELFNPTRQYFYQTIFKKALYPDDQQLPLDPVIDEYLRPEKKIWPKVQHIVQNVKQKFNLKVQEIKQNQKSAKVFWKELIDQQNKSQEQLQQMILEQQLQQQQMIQIDSEEVQQLADPEILAKAGKKFAFEEENIVRNISGQKPIEDFRKMIEETKEDLVDSALNQMKEIINRLIKESFQGSHYLKAIDCLKEMRKACIKEDEVKFFNEYITELKALVNNDTHLLFWNQLLTAGITLITQEEHKSSNVSAKEAVDFLVQEQKLIHKINPQIQKDDDDLINEIE